jgi:PPOX class probable F420-dependent enzyme
LTTGTGRTLADLPEEALRILETVRRGVLATVGSEGTPHVVPVVFAIVEERIFLPLDAKPKSGGPLVRVKNVQSRGRATLLVDRWSEDWLQLGWVMVRGRAEIEDLGDIAQTLIARYPQYEATGTSPGRSAIVLTPTMVSWWWWSE